MTAVDEATGRQHRAADPAHSTWVSANAGSGKTRVLTDRVARLLLHGTQPESILCLTYTKAAATEMQNRLFGLLGAWAMMDDGHLREGLRTLGETGPLDPPLLATARRLFARALETPGGLKIQTIHAFCASILRRFPLEAGVNPNFRELDDRQRAQLFEEVFEDIATDMPDVFLAAATRVGDAKLAALPEEILRHRRIFSAAFDADEIRRVLGFDAEETAAGVRQDFVTNQTLDTLASLQPALEAGRKEARAAARQLAGLDIVPSEQRFDIIAAALTKADGNVYVANWFCTNAMKAVAPDSEEVLEPLLDRLDIAHKTLRALDTHDATQELHAFASAFLTRYDARKAALGLLDFDDQIEKTRALLSEREVSAWVLYKLDGGIDHILVDEAQDTAPAQWDVIRMLTDGFHGGLGADADRTRTVFVVGDAKQSIYSFQGADLDTFTESNRTLQARLQESGAALNSVELQHSFRSAGAILDVVDKVCGDPEWSGGHGEVTHRAFHADRPGRVDLWPLVPPAETEEHGDWSRPLDLPRPTDPTLTLARTIAEEVRRWLDGEEGLPTEDGLRAIRAEDVLILVRSRSELFRAIIRELKARDVPVAGADRLKLMDEIGVRDLIALARFAVTPVDDLSLAAALRSPLFGVSEADLFDLAHGRGRQSLIARVQSDERFSAVAARLQDLRQHADFLRPFEFFHRILVEQDGRRSLLARLGEEAADAIDELLAQTLTYEQVEAPTLTGFLEWIGTDNVEITRQLDKDAGLVRVMTVHGAKGLEAPIVILPQTEMGTSGDHRAFTVDREGHVLARGGSPRAEAVSLFDETIKTRGRAEHDRLLYVALTRAERWLIVAGLDLKKKRSGGWHGAVSRALETLPGTTSHPAPHGIEGSVLSYRQRWEIAPVAPEGATVGEDVALPDWAHTLPEGEAAQPGILNPSRLAGAHALPGESDPPEIAMARGDGIHRLLEALVGVPVGERDAVAAMILPEASEHDRASWLGEAARVVDKPELAPLFDGSAVMEVPVTGMWQGAPVFGRVDLLQERADGVHLVDFKSNRVVPDRPEDIPSAILAQLALYRAVLTPSLDGVPLHLSVLWTAPVRLMPVPHAILDEVTPRPLPPA